MSSCQYYFLILFLTFSICACAPLPIHTVQNAQEQMKNEPACPPVIGDVVCSNAKNECDFDRDCRIDGPSANSAKLCCFNGCATVCIEKPKPPPVIDWLVEPKPKGNSRYFWLTDEDDFDAVQGDQGITQTGPDFAADCTIPPLSEDDLHSSIDSNLRQLCPEGYECILFDSGDSTLGIPGRGWCQLVRKYVL